MSGYARARVYQDEPRRRLQGVVDSLLAGEQVRNVLDVGCGFQLPLDFPLNVQLAGIDASPEALAKNENVDERIVGDIQTYPLPVEGFDVVVCWNVLEHVPHPQAALANIARTLRPGGLLVVSVPNVWSLKGLVTKVTPHRFHVWVYRRMLGWQDAGQPEVGPYPTYLRRDLWPGRFSGIAAAKDLHEVYRHIYGEVPPEFPAPVRVAWGGLAMLVKALSLGRLDILRSEHIAVFRKDVESGERPTDATA